MSSADSSTEAGVGKAMRATSTDFIMGFDGPWRVGATLAQRSPGCLHSIIPSSLGIPERTNSQWAEYFSTVAPLVHDAHMTIHDYLANLAERRAVARSSMTATTAVGEYTCEYVWFFEFNDTGDQVVKVTEFIDTKAAGDLLAKFKEAGLR